MTDLREDRSLHVSPCGCSWRFYRWGGWSQEGACTAHPIEPEPNDRPTPEERQMYAEWGSRSARLP